jgi:hypothetical protein
VTYGYYAKQIRPEHRERLRVLVEGAGGVGDFEGATVEAAS